MSYGAKQPRNFSLEQLWELYGIGRGGYAYPPKPMGRYFFVDHFAGNNSYSGRSRSDPFKTITYALTQCVSDRDDVIIVMDAWDQEPDVITVNKTRVHIIGMALPTGMYPALQAIGDNPVFLLQSAANNCEIAGLSLGGGDAHAGIEFQNCYTSWLHDLWFGHPGVGQTPQDGIRNVAALNYQALRVERCSFFSSTGPGTGTITRYGIYMNGSGPNGYAAQFVDNRFFCCTYAIRLVYGRDQLIEHNRIICPADDVVGRGIYLDACAGNIVSNNKAGDNGVADMTNSPYYDNQSASNAWLCNQNGVTYEFPATAL